MGTKVDTGVELETGEGRATPTGTGFGLESDTGGGGPMGRAGEGGRDSMRVTLSSKEPTLAFNPLRSDATDCSVVFSGANALVNNSRIASMVTGGVDPLAAARGATGESWPIDGKESLPDSLRLRRSLLPMISNEDYAT